MAKKQEDPEAQSLMDEYEKALDREREAYEQLPPNEQKEYREAQEQFQNKMDSMNYY